MSAQQRGPQTGTFDADGDDARWWRVASLLLEAPSLPPAPRSLPRALEEDRPLRPRSLHADLPRALEARHATGSPLTPVAVGPAAAALLAAGVACALFGFVVILAELSPGVASLLSHPAAVGPLSGKALFTIAGWLGTWAVLHCRLRHRDVDPAPLMRRALVLTALGFLATFPPVFQLFSR